MEATPEAPKSELTEGEIEPRVLTEDVSTILARVVYPDDPDQGDSVALIAHKADTSTRTVYRVISVERRTLSLDLADRLCLAADAHLAECRLEWPDGRVTSYYD